MAIYQTDFSEYDTGSPPADWTERWNPGHMSEDIAADATEHIIGGKKLELRHTADSWQLFSWNEIPTDEPDVDVLVKLAPIVATYNYPFRVIVRGSGAQGSENCYFLEWQTTALDHIAIRKRVAGVNAGLAYCDFDIGASSWYWLRFRVEGTSLKAKLWSRARIEPAEWHLEATNGEISGGGWVGVGGYGQHCDVDHIAVATGGTWLKFEQHLPQQVKDQAIRYGYTYIPGSSTTAVNWTRGFGGPVAPDARKNLTGVRVYAASATSNYIRVGVYSGGDLETGPEGATLLYDFGKIQDDSVGWKTASCSPVAIPAGQPLWMLVKGDDNAFLLRNTGAMDDIANMHCGNFQIARGRFDDGGTLDNDEDVAFPSTFPTQDSSAGFDYRWFAMVLDVEDQAVPLTTLNPVAIVIGS